jgi:hypothetical protein
LTLPARRGLVSVVTAANWFNPFTQIHPMKKAFLLLVPAVLSLTLLTGCLNLQLGGGSKTENQRPTVGEQLIDLKKAREAGAITDAEYEAQKVKLLNQK